MPFYSPLPQGWVTWSPTLANLTVGSGSVTAAYVQFGKTIHYRFAFTLAADSAVGTGPTFTLPTVPITYGQSGTSQAPVGTCNYEDTGNNAYAGYGRIASANNVCTLLVFRGDGTFVNMSGLTATVPFTWGTGDSMICIGTYESQ